MFIKGEIVKCSVDYGKHLRVGGVYEIDDVSEDAVKISGNWWDVDWFTSAKSTTYEQRVQAFELYVALVRADGDDGRYTPETVLAFLAP